MEAAQTNDTSLGNGASTISKAEIQRQRRSRQLEETQRLLDGYDSIKFGTKETNPTKQEDMEMIQKDRLNSHSVVSQEHLGRIRSGKYNSDEVRHKKKSAEYASLTKGKSVTRNGTFVDSSQSLSVFRDDVPLSTLGERPIEGRGRGRGRGRITTAGSHSSSLGEKSHSSESISNSQSRKMVEQRGSREVNETSHNQKSSAASLQSYLRLVVSV